MTEEELKNKIVEVLMEVTYSADIPTVEYSPYVNCWVASFTHKNGSHSIMHETLEDVLDMAESFIQVYNACNE